VDLAHALGKRNAWAHRDPAHLDAQRANHPMQGSTRHTSWLTKADQSITRSKEDWVLEFLATYSSPMPIWMAVEAWDFGTLSWLLEMAHPNDRAAIAKRYGLLPDTLVSWVKSLAFVRNICAHHARLWNAGIVNQPKVPKAWEAAQVVHIGDHFVQRSRVYGATAAASHLIKRINPGTTWSSRMKDHWLAFPAMPFANAAQGGFLPGWDQETIWA
jgi:abortive infection bacteriophage resistance protein